MYALHYIKGMQVGSSGRHIYAPFRPSSGPAGPTIHWSLRVMPGDFLTSSDLTVVLLPCAWSS